MEEEKKNKNGIIIGVIIFLFICLIAIIFFMFKMVYVGDKTNENTNTTDAEEPTDEGFNELTKYELQEGEEKEITIGEKKYVVKLEKDIYYLNNKEIGTGKGDKKVYVTNNLIIFTYMSGQSGSKFYIYNLSEEKVTIEDNGGQDAQYIRMRIKNNKLFVDTASAGECINPNAECYFFNERLDPECVSQNSKNITEYPEEIEKHKDEEIYTTTYEIKYNNNVVTINKAEDINTIEKWLATYEKVCLRGE